MSATSTVYGPPPPSGAETPDAPIPVPKPEIALVPDADSDSGAETVQDRAEGILTLDEVAPVSEQEAAEIAEAEDTPDDAPAGSVDDDEEVLELTDRLDAEPLSEPEPEPEPEPEEKFDPVLASDPEIADPIDPVEEVSELTPAFDPAPLVEPDSVPVADAVPVIAPKPKPRSVRSARPTGRRSLQRENRWKRRGASKLTRRLIGGAIAAVLCLALLIAVRLSSGETVTGPDGEFGQAVYEAFPEADPQRILTVENEDLPSAATLHLPAYLIEPASGSDPFARLGTQFGGAERTLSGVEMGARIEQVAASVLPTDLPRCYTYEVGAISSPPESPRQTRALHLRLNPGC